MCMGLLKAGDHVVCSHSMFGSTIKLIGSEFAKFGVQSSFVSQTDVAQWKAAVKPNTRLLFAETPTNPLTDVCDIRALADIAHEAGALLAVDNCFCTPALQRPVELGADLIVHSGTKYLDGQGRVMAGALCGSRQMMNEVLLPVLRSAGMTLSPFNAWVVLKGLETLGIRMQAQCQRALELATWLEQQPQVSRVYYTGLPSHPQHALAMAQQSGQGGAVIAFDLRADDPQQARARAFSLLDTHASHRPVHQPGRCEVAALASGQHLAWPTDRGPAPGCRHRPGAGALGGRARACGRPEGRPATGLCRTISAPNPGFARPPGGVRGNLGTARRFLMSNETPMTRKIRTRIAPSPTGFLHLGTARTALFSWAFARHFGGDFILRIEDTDVARSTQQAVDQIIAAMRWLDLGYEEGPYYQMQRLERYRAVIAQMLKDGTAYHCYCQPDELDAMREAQRARGDKPRYDGRWRPEPGKTLPAPPPGLAPVVRFRNPLDGDVSWDDLVKGTITISNRELDDLIIARADGTPTYNFCVVVDDWDMQISHVLRGDDHVNNTPRQINILRALGAELPVYGHLPMILGPDGDKLSKRHGAVSVMQYEEAGYLPEAMVNYLSRLGWSHGDDELFDRDQHGAMVRWCTSGARARRSGTPPN